MNTSNFEAVSNLNEILAETINSRLRYRAVAKYMKDDKLSRICANIALQRTSYINEIETAIRELGGEPDERGTALGKAHRSWIAIRSVLGDSKKGVLKECMRGDKFVIDQHRGMLGHHDELPYYIKSTLKRHLSQVEADYSRLERIHDYLSRTESM